MRSALGKSLKGYLALAAALSLAALVGGLVIFVGLQNRQALKSERAMVAGGISAFINSAQITAMDYGWWDEALQRVEQNDIPWMYENIGSPIEATGIFDLVAFDLAGKASFGWDQSHITPDLPEVVLDSATISKMRSALIGSYENDIFISSAFLDVAGEPMLLTATILGDVEDRSQIDPATAPMIVTGHRLDEQFVDEIASTFLLKDMRLKPEIADGTNAIEITDEEGRSAGFLTWQPSRPGYETARLAALPLAVIIVVFATLMVVINLRAGRMAMVAMQSELEAKMAARTDRLTGLDNRHGFNEYVESAVCRSSAQAGELAILFFDLNGFKAINDGFGHATGDLVLTEVADRFLSKLPANTRLARIGGDEFACVVTGQMSAGDVHEIALSLISRLEDPIIIDKAEHTVSAAVGYALATASDPVDVDTLIHRADLAMYKAKSEGLKEPLTYSSELEAERKRRRALLDDLEAGLRNGEIYVEYQPIVSARTGEVMLVEALARWKSPTRGLVSPDEFVAIAEEYGFIHELGAFVLQSACAALRESCRVPIAVNVSPVQLQDPALCEKFQQIIADAGVDPEMIEIELTENVLVSNPALAKSRLQQLSDAGFRISLDDYGAGFSSLGYLREFPFDKVKIDRSFVRDCDLEKSKHQVLRSLSLLANAYDLKIVAEGVETAEEARFLSLMGYDYLQGYHFGRPAHVDMLIGLGPKEQNLAAETA